jgi:uncharacterized membrane protein
MVTVTLYRKTECEDCDSIIQLLQELQSIHPHQLAIINVDELEDWNQKDSHTQFPYVKVGPYVLHAPFRKTDLQVALGASIDRASHLEAVGDSEYKKRILRGHTITKTDRFSYWLSKNLMLIINLVIFIYAGLPFLAPVLMKANIVAPARVIYAMYSPLCHQLGFRSWFLFGEQLYYPRNLAGISGLKTFEEETGITSNEILQARAYIGDAKVGYKVALCERDTAIYGTMLLFGIIFMLTGRKTKALPWYAWLTVGLIPIGLDGFSQLPGLATGLLPAWVPIRESTPLLRVVTGALFGGTTAAYLFPMLEESMRETRTLLGSKMVIADQLKSTDVSKS